MDVHRTWVVRRALVADAGQLAELAGATFPLACPPGFDAEAIARHIRQRLSVDAFRINLADVSLEYAIGVVGQDRAVGYLALSTADSADIVAGQRLLELKQIYVRTDYQGTGLADELMALAIARASELGFAGVWLGTSKVNARAIAFYRRHGFTIAGDRVFLVSDLPNDDWVLVRLAD